MNHTKQPLLPIIKLVPQSLYVLTFLILTSLIIIGANGYRFNFRTGTFQQTGIISITVKPEKVLVTLDDLPTEKDKSPVKLSYLLPGRHTVQIEKPGYITWAKTIQVGSGEAIVYPFVRLFLSDTKPVLATLAQETLLQARLDVPLDPDIDIRGSEIWVKPISRTYPIKVASNEHALVSRYASPVGKVIWLPGKTHIIYQVDNEIRIMERDGANEIAIAKLSKSDITNFTVTNDGKYVIYQDDQTVWQKQIQ